MSALTPDEQRMVLRVLEQAYDELDFECSPTADEVAVVLQLLLRAFHEPESEKQQLTDALVEMQSASWSRSWRRVQAARKTLKELTGLEVPGPLRAALERKRGQ